jgi:hypothetical protein
MVRRLFRIIGLGAFGTRRSAYICVCVHVCVWHILIDRVLVVLFLHPSMGLCMDIDRYGTRGVAEYCYKLSSQ